MPGRPTLCLLLLLTGLYSANAVMAKDPEERPASATQRLPVICPAVTHGLGPRNNGVIGLVNGIDLVVVGKWSQLDGGGAAISVEEVLFGATAKKKILRSVTGLRREGDRRIFTFCSYPYPDKPWVLLDSYAATPANLAAARALSDARLTFYSLAASAVFIGRKTSIAAWPEHGMGHAWWRRFLRNVEVSRVLEGAADLKGRTVQVVVKRGARRSSEPPHLPTGEMLYFMGKDLQVKEILGRGPWQRLADNLPTHVGAATLPAKLADQVVAILEDRSTHPVVEVTTDDGKRRVRRILYPGSIEEAMLVLGTAWEQAAWLAQSGLVHNHKESRAVVISAIEKQLPDTTTGEAAHYRRQRRLIWVLARIENRHPRGDLAALVEKAIARILRNDPAAPPRRELNSWGREPPKEEVNHSLTCLLVAMGKERARLTYGPRLLDLLNKARGGWKSEVAYALKTLRVQEDLAILEALDRAGGSAHSVHSAELSRIKYSPRLFISADGRRVRALGSDGIVLTWDTVTLKLLRKSKVSDGYWVCRASEPDASLLLCLMEGSHDEDWSKGRPAEVLDTEAGKVILRTILRPPFTGKGGGYRSFAHWIPGERALLLVSDEHDRLGRLDVDSGALTPGARTKVRRHLQIDETGRFLFATARRSKSWKLELDRIEIDTGEIVPIRPKDKAWLPTQEGGLVPGGQFFYLTRQDLYIYDRATCKLIARKQFQGAETDGISFSADGSRYAVLHSHRVFTKRVRERSGPTAQQIVRVIETLSGRTVFARPVEDWGTVRLSADGLKLAFAGSNGTLSIWTVPSPK